MTYTTRPLNAQDFEAVKEIIRSRADDKLLGVLAIDPDLFINVFQQQTSGRPLTMGAFLDGELDSFIVWRYIKNSPRADDLTRFETASNITMHWSRKRPGRLKEAGDHDVARSTLSKAQLELFERIGVGTGWVVAPASWRITTDAPLLAAVMQRWVRAEMATLPAGSAPTGPAADFVAANLMAVNETGTDLVARAISLKDEYRNAGQGS